MQAQEDALRAESIIRSAPYDGKAPIMRPSQFQDNPSYLVVLEAAEAVLNFRSDYRIPVQVDVDYSRGSLTLRDPEQEGINFASNVAMIVIHNHSQYRITDSALISLEGAARMLIDADINDAVIIVDH